MSRLLATFLLCVASLAHAQTATYNLSTGLLTIPFVTVGTTTYSGAQLVLGANGQWALQSLGSPSVPSSTAACTTTVAPQDAVTMSVTPASLSGVTGQTINFVIAGGVPPYRLISTNNELALVSFFQQDGSALSAVGSISVGSSSTSSATIVASDCTGSVVAVPFTKVGGATASTMSVFPSSASGKFGQGFVLVISGGSPPYSTLLSSNTGAVVIDGIDWDGTSARAILRIHLDAENASDSVFVLDSGSNVVSIPVAARP